MAVRLNMDKHPKTGVYRYRKGVAEIFRPYLPAPHTNKRELIKSLETKDKALADRRHIAVSAEMEKILDIARLAEAKANPGRSKSGIWLDMKPIIKPIEQDDFQLFISHGFDFSMPTVSDEPSEIIKPKIGKVTSMQSVFDAYAREENIKEDTKDKFQNGLNKFCEFNGLTMNDDISLPTLAMIRDFKRAIADYPNKTTAKMQEMGIHKLLDYARSEYANPDRTTTFKAIEAGTIKQYMAAISVLFKFAAVSGERLDDPTASGICKVKNATKSRPAYNQDDLKGIFNHSIYKEEKAKWNHFQWLPLLSLYMGARQGELANLLIEDIKQDGDIFYIAIRETNDEGEVIKSLKTKASTRNIPIPAKLIALGFLDYVDRIKQAGLRRLFPDLTSIQYFSSWYGQQREAFGIRDERKVYHSLRHSFRDALRRLEKRHDITDEISKYLMGHANRGVHNSYGDGYDLADYKEAIDKIDYGLEVT